MASAAAVAFYTFSVNQSENPSNLIGRVSSGNVLIRIEFLKLAAWMGENETKIYGTDQGIGSDLENSVHPELARPIRFEGFSD